MSEKRIVAREEALKRTVDRLEALMEEIPIGVVNVDIKGKITYVNKTVLQGTGYLREELVGKNAFRLSLFPRETLKVLGGRMKDKLMGKPPSPLETQFKRKDGQWMWVEISGRALWEHGVPVGIQIVGQDITERKRAEQELRESEERYRALLNLGTEVGEAVTMLQDTEQGEGVQTFVNDEWPRVTGYSREELLGMSFFDLIHPKHREASMERHRRKMQGEAIPGLFEMSIIRKDGSEVTVELTSAYTTYKGKRANVAYIRDITEFKRLQEQLVRSEKLAAIGQLAGGVGHELRNPLGAIKNAVYYIKGKVAESELGQKEPRVMEFLDIMDDEINSSAKIIGDLLGFSRVGKPSVLPTQIENVIEDALLHAPIPENIELTKRLDADLPEVEIDADQVHQVLANIILNAVEAMPEGGKLAIAAREKERFLEVEIADTGCRIPQEAMDKIFDPLFTTKAKGIGLGLAVCKAIIDRHEGNIEVESRVGKGTTFTIRLPLKTG